MIGKTNKDSILIILLYLLYTKFVKIVFYNNIHFLFTTYKLFLYLLLSVRNFLNLLRE